MTILISLNEMFIYLFMLVTLPLRIVSLSNMASSSSKLQYKYDVFLSFRGKDTRDNFTSHLYDALCRKKIKTFIDNELERGEEITPKLLETIEESRISVIIFSKSYASSPWCVDELVKILECKENRGQIVLPVFYHVNPCDVEEQSGSFGSAFLELENIFKEKMDKFPRWREDLTKAANISGWDSYITRPESKLVNEIVEHVLKILNHGSSTNLKGLVGIDSCIRQVKSLLCTGLSIVRVLGIWGMGGIGKTTIAGAIFSSISSQYEGSCFLSNVREESKKCGGLISLREELLSKLLEEQNFHISTPDIGSTSIKDRLRRKKVLVVLDDVNDVAQVEFLIGTFNMFGLGSRVMITSRDKQVLKNRADKIYEVQGLNDHEALQLFSLSAFKENYPKKDHVDLSNRAVKCAQGNPLALKVLGSLLFKRSKQDWESTLSKLERVPLPKIHNVLKISYDVLDNEERRIFLDIACFLKGQQIDFVQGILNVSDIEIRVLAEKCLIAISENKIGMHDLLQGMAHEIVSQESINELGKRSRLWNPRDVYQVLTKNLGSEKVEGIFLDTSNLRELKLSSRAFNRMHNLRLLKIYDSSIGNNFRVHIPHGLESLSDELRYLHWDGFPLRSLPSSFQPENLVKLNLAYSNVQQMWTGVQNIASLKEINLGHCKHLTTIPDLSLATNLERLNFDYCTSLVEFPPSVQFLDKLVDLDLRYCTSLMSLPSRINLRSLKTFNCSGCSNLKRCPEIKGNITYMNLNETAIKELPQSIGYLDGLVALNLKGCKQLGNLPDNICSMKSLIIVDLSGCSSITRFPNKFSENIRYLYLSDTGIEKLPSSIGSLSRLSTLDLMNCKRLKNLPWTVSKLASLQKLILSGCSNITIFPEVSRNIKELYLNGTSIREIPSSIEWFSELVELHLCNSTEFEILPSSICKLKSLQKLNLSGCSKFENFPEILETMGSLRYLYLDGTAIRKLPFPIKNLYQLSVLELGNCKNLDKRPEFYVSLPDWIAHLEYLRKLCLSACGISHLPCSIRCFSSLEALDLGGNNFQRIGISFKNFSELQYLGLRSCQKLEVLPELPPRLAKLDANDCTSLRTVPTTSTAIEGNICDFFFTNCFNLDDIECNNIMAYALLKIQIYAKKLYNKRSSVPAGPSSFCIPGSTIPKWFGNQSLASSITVQLPSLANNDFSGFLLCAVVAFDSYFEDSSFQLRSSYHFKNNYGDCQDLDCDFGVWYGWKSRRFAGADHLFFGYDPCSSATKNDMFGNFSEVLIKFYPEDMNNNPLLCCNVIECGVHLLYTQDEKYVDFVKDRASQRLILLIEKYKARVVDWEGRHKTKKRHLDMFGSRVTKGHRSKRMRRIDVFGWKYTERED